MFVQKCCEFRIVGCAADVISVGRLFSILGCDCSIAEYRRLVPGDMDAGVDMFGYMQHLFHQHYEHHRRVIVRILDSNGTVLKDLTGMNAQEKNEAWADCMLSGEDLFFELGR